MPITYSSVQYSGIWTMQQVDAAIAAGTWPTQPAPGLFAWGFNANGQLGVGNTTQYSSPKQVGSLKTWASVVNGVDNGATLALKADGTLWAWGSGAVYGALGLGNTTKYSSPVQVGALTNWSKISAAFQTSAAIKTNGTLWAWGRNDRGAIGDGTSANKSSPVQIGALTDWLKIAGGQYHFAALRTNGTLWTWGYNAQGQLGQGNTTSYSSPKQVGALTTWANITCAAYSVLAIKTDGTIWSWGQNDAGQLGLGNITSYSSPKQIGALTTWSNANVGANGYGYHVVMIKSTGDLWAWGNNTYGQLGLNNRTKYSSPKQVGALTNWLSVSCGGYHTLSIKTDGSLWSFGISDGGQLGLGNKTYYSSPKQVGSLASWVTTGAGYSTSFGIANV